MKFLFPHQFDTVIQSPFFLAPEEYAELERCVRSIHQFQPPQSKGSLQLSRPEFIKTGNKFKLIDLNYSSSISSYSYSSLLSYFRNHPVVSEFPEFQNTELKDDFDFNLSAELKKICAHRSIKNLLFLDCPYDSYNHNESEAMRHISKLQSSGICIDIINPRLCKIKINNKSIQVNGRTYDAVMIGFLTKYIDTEAWIKNLVEELDKKGLLLSDYKIESFMMSKANIVSMAEQSNYSHLASKVVRTDSIDKITLKKIYLEKKDSWVLKHVDGNNSEQVIIGRNVNKKKWVEAVLCSLKCSDWVLQEFLNSDLVEVPALVKGRLKSVNTSPVYSPFVIDGRIVGILVKAYVIRKGKIALDNLLPGIAKTYKNTKR